MNSNLKLLALGTTLFALTGCFGSTPMDDFVGQTVKFAPNKDNTLTGELRFTEVVYGTAFETRCDYVQVCDGRWGEVVAQADQLAMVRGRDGDDHRGGDRDDHRGGRGGRGDHGDHGGGYYHAPSCHQEPVNCREVQVTTRDEFPITSKVTVTLKGNVDAKAIGTLALGVQTNYRFANAFEKPETRPRGFETLFDTLAKTDNNVLELISKDYVLTAVQNFLTVPADFKRGDAIKLEVDVQKADNSTLGVTVVGTSQEFPSLTFSQ